MTKHRNLLKMQSDKFVKSELIQKAPACLQDGMAAISSLRNPYREWICLF